MSPVPTHQWLLILKDWVIKIFLYSTQQQLANFLCSQLRGYFSAYIVAHKKYKNRSISVKITNFVIMQPVTVLPVRWCLYNE